MSIFVAGQRTLCVTDTQSFFTKNKEYEVVDSDEGITTFIDNDGDALMMLTSEARSCFDPEPYIKPEWIPTINGDMKYDTGKPKAGTLYEYFPNALKEVAEVSTFGAIKYERGSFHNVPNGLERYTDAMHRHLLEEQSGELLDPESKLRHAAHAAWGALCRLEFIIRQEKQDGNTED